MIGPPHDSDRFEIGPVPTGAPGNQFGPYRYRDLTAMNHCQCDHLVGEVHDEHRCRGHGYEWEGPDAPLPAPTAWDRLTDPWRWLTYRLFGWLAL